MIDYLQKSRIDGKTAFVVGELGLIGKEVSTVLAIAGKNKTQSQTFVNHYSKKVPLKRLGRADEIASTALFLASEASSYITGSTIIVDGGWSSI